MADLPSGTVTFLFTDIEGSTRLVAQLGERYPEALDGHRRVLRRAFAAHGGREVGTEGDAFFVAFARATDAVGAAVVGQRALASARWPEGSEIRVRMGIHTGEAALRADGYVGLAVHRAARICSAGHGGQILVSGVTRELLGDDLPADVALRDLGQYRLKDLDRPEQLFQVVVAHLRANFPLPEAEPRPGLRAAGAVPPSPNRTVGRDADVRAIADRLGPGGARLLTLTGPGGVGKTRLGLEVARAVDTVFDDGVRFVSLAALRRAEDIPAAILRSLQIVPLSDETPAGAITRFLAGKRVLLVLDNFEHVLEGASLVGEFLLACPTLTILATSREPLRLQAEEGYPVPPLAAPPRDIQDSEALAGADAVVLFSLRARALEPDFSLDDGNLVAVAEICRRVDGLPLAIELAAARCGLLSPEEIAKGLDASLGVLGPGARDAPARQRTLAATIDWSHDLLGNDERECFARFAVFAGGATVDAARAITGAGLDTLDRLVAKSLVVRRRRPHAPTRLVMLETIRAYAADRLASTGDENATRERHYAHYLALAQRDGTERALWSSRRDEHLAGLDAEADNIDEMLRWASAQPEAAPALMAAGAVTEYWQARNRFADAIAWIDHALSKPGADAHQALCVRLLTVKAVGLWNLGRSDEQGAVWAQAETIARSIDDPLVLSQALEPRVVFESLSGRLDAAEALANETLRAATAAEADWQIAMGAFASAMAAPNIGELRQRVERAASMLVQVGNVYHLANLLASAAYGALRWGCDGDAQGLIERAIAIARELDDPLIWLTVHGNHGLAAIFGGDSAVAERAFREQLMLCRELVARPFASEGLRGLAAVSAVRGDEHRAARLVGASDAQRHGQGFEAVEARLDAAFFDAVRVRLGTDTWRADFRRGAELSFDDAIRYALDGSLTLP